MKAKLGLIFGNAILIIAAWACSGNGTTGAKPGGTDNSNGNDPWAAKEAQSSVYNAVEVGNGGNLVVCRNREGAVTKIEVLDFYEGRLLRGVSPELGPSDIAYMSKVYSAIERLTRLDPYRSKRYKEWAEQFQSDMILLSDVDLPVVDDVGDLVLQHDCRIRQTVVQKEPRYPQDKRYKINKAYWDEMDNDSKAGMVLHEIVYREAIASGHKSSMHVRNFVSVMASRQLHTMSFPEYKKLLHSIEFIPGYENSGFVFDIEHLELDSDGRAITGMLAAPTEIVHSDSKSRYRLPVGTKIDLQHNETGVRVTSFFLPSSSTFVLADGCQMEFGRGTAVLDENQLLRSFVAEKLLDTHVCVAEKPRVKSMRHLRFDDWGRINELVFDRPESFHVFRLSQDRGKRSEAYQPFRFAPGTVQFWPNGRVMNGVSDEDHWVSSTWEGTLVFIQTHQGSAIEFAESGRAVVRPTLRGSARIISEHSDSGSNWTKHFLISGSVSPWNREVYYPEPNSYVSFYQNGSVREFQLNYANLDFSGCRYKTSGHVLLSDTKAIVSLRGHVLGFCVRTSDGMVHSFEQDKTLELIEFWENGNPRTLKAENTYRFPVKEISESDVASGFRTMKFRNFLLNNEDEREVSAVFHPNGNLHKAVLDEERQFFISKDKRLVSRTRGDLLVFDDSGYLQ